MSGFVRWMAAAGAAAALAACHDGPTAAGGSGLRVVAEPAELSLTVGGRGWIGAQVLGSRGSIVHAGEIVFSTGDSTVAVVHGDGEVVATGPGSTTVLAAYGAAHAAVAVSVHADGRSALAGFDILPQFIELDLRNPAAVFAEFEALDGFGRNLCGQVFLTFRPQTVAAVARRTLGPGICALQIYPMNVGETTLRVATGPLSDSVRLRVVDGGYRAFFAEGPPPGNLRAGDRVEYRARMLDPSGNPVPGRPVLFTVSRGYALRDSVLTDDAGVATLQWALPTGLAAAGGRATVALQARLPNGSIAVDSRDVRVVAAPAARIWFFYQLRGRAASTTSPFDDSLVTRVTTSAEQPLEVYVMAAATDRFGNYTADLQVAATRSILASGQVETYPETMYASCDEARGYLACSAWAWSLPAGRYDFAATADGLHGSAYLKLTVCQGTTCTRPPD